METQKQELLIINRGSLSPECPSKKDDAGKLRYDLLPPECLQSLADVLTFGADLYGSNNWQQLDDFANRYYAALERHIQAWRQGENVDSKSGRLHLAHAACNAIFLLWGAINDDQQQTI